MVTLKVIAVGNSMSVILPKEVAIKLKIEKGDTIYLTETPDGYRLTPYSPEREKQMNVACKVMKRRRNALRVLAK